MKAVLICPSPRAGVPLLSQSHPLAGAPLLGQSLLEYWLSWLAGVGAKEVQVLAHDRPDLVEAIADNGARWGLDLQVIAESRELTPAEVRLKYGTDPAEVLIEVLDHFPGLAAQPLFTSYTDFFTALRQWIPFALMPDRVGVHQARPGVWIGSHSQIAPDAELTGPCWIGNRVFVGSRAKLGPGAVIEDGAFLEPGVEVVESLIGPDTFVGSLARVVRSLAWGQTLVNWQSSSVTLVPDSFLLCAVREPRRPRTAGSRLGKLAETYGRTKEEAFLAWKQLLLHKGG